MRGKIAPVDDDLCQRCSQAWEDKCRAFCVPHSKEEQAQREKDPRALCQGSHPDDLIIGSDPKVVAT